MGGRRVARSHAGLRVLLWAYGWEYPLPLIKQSLLHVIRQASKLVFQREASPLEFLRWFFLSSHAFSMSQLSAAPKRTARDVSREEALKSFAKWGGLLTWAEFDLFKALAQVDPTKPRSMKEIARSLLAADERILDIARDQARRILHALFPPGHLPEDSDVRALFETEKPTSGTDDWIAWSALNPVISETPKILRYLGLLIGWQIAVLQEANLKIGGSARFKTDNIGFITEETAYKHSDP